MLCLLAGRVWQAHETLVAPPARAGFCILLHTLVNMSAIPQTVFFVHSYIFILIHHCRYPYPKGQDGPHPCSSLFLWASPQQVSTPIQFCPLLLGCTGCTQVRPSEPPLLHCFFPNTCSFMAFKPLRKPGLSISMLVLHKSKAFQSIPKHKFCFDFRNCVESLGVWVFASRVTSGALHFGVPPSHYALPSPWC